MKNNKTTRRFFSNAAIAILSVTIAPVFQIQASSAPPPHRVFESSRFSMDEILARPYSREVPMGCVGDRVWATSPQGWGFENGVHFIYLSNFKPFDIKIRLSGRDIVPAEATYFPSHVEMKGGWVKGPRGSASFTFRSDDPQNPLSKPFVPRKRWTCWSSGKRTDWYSVDFGRRLSLRGFTVYFFDDAPQGGCRPPESFAVEVWDGNKWCNVSDVKCNPSRPAPGKNVVTFAPVETDRIRLVLHNAGKNFYTGIYGIEFVGKEMEKAAEQELPFDVTGAKFITKDDVLMSVLTITNKGSEPQEATVTIEGDCFNNILPDNNYSTGTVEVKGIKAVYLAGYKTDPPVKNIHTDGGGVKFRFALLGGRSARIRIGVSYGISPEEVRTNLSRWMKAKNPTAVQAAEYQKWFDDNIAYFDCPDKWVKKMYYHRWYNIRKNSMWSRVGLLKYHCFSEGRWTSEWFSNVISYGAGHQIRESRWLRDPSYWKGHLRTFCDTIRPNGIFRNYCSPTGGGNGQYTDWISSTAWDGYCVHPDKKFLRIVAPALRKNVEGWKNVFDRDNDYLLVVDSHWWTGMEWQPSFFYFAKYHTDRRTEADLERVDLTSYNYGNAANLAKIYEVLGEGDLAEHYHNFAEAAKAAVQLKMWDNKTRYFYSLRWNDDAKSWVKEVIGVYPFYFAMPDRDKGYESAWDHILNPKEFWTKWPVASASRDCPAYSQNGWPIGPGGSGCMWNGPTWPHANSLVLTAMARTLRLYGKCSLTRRKLYELFHSYTMAQYLNQDYTFPWTGEYYNGDTGKWKTNQRDYNHSTYNDILIEVLLGIVPRPDGVLEIHPLVPEGVWDHFLLDGQYYHGHDITLAWDAPDGKDYYGDNFEGFAVYVDGRRVATLSHIGRITYKLD